MDLNPNNDLQPECKARERVARMLFDSGMFVTHIAFSVVKDGEVYFADGFEYIGQGQYIHDPDGVNRLYRIGSTSKSVTAVTAKMLEEQGALSFSDFVNDNDGSQLGDGPYPSIRSAVHRCTLRQLLTHQGAFHLDVGALHLYCYNGDLLDFWRDPDDLVSPHYESSYYGNYGGGYEYSAFNYSLAGANLAQRTGMPFDQLVQEVVFDRAQMCTATFDGSRAVATPIGDRPGTSQTGLMHVGPYINLESLYDRRIIDNFYSSDDLPGQQYDWQVYHLDEADAPARDPAGGVMASVVDMAHFAEMLLSSYRQPGGLVSQAGIRDLWGATQDLGCYPNCPYEPYYGVGFFTNAHFGEPVTQVEHGGSRPGFASAFVLRPEANLAVCILANADVSTVTLSNLAKTILDDFSR